MYGKLFEAMFDGSLVTRGPWEAIVTLQQLVILCNAHGEVDMTPAAISNRTTIPLPLIEKGLAALEQPDPESRNPAEDGRRIVRLSEMRTWGWRIVNYEHYRQLRSAEERREYQRNYQRDRRSSAGVNTSQQSSTPVNTVNHASTESTKAVSSKQKQIKQSPEQAAVVVEIAPRARPPESPRCLALKAICTANHVGKDAAELALYAAQWATEGVEDWQLVEAIRIAREERGKPLPKRLPAKFIAAILVDVVSGDHRPPIRAPEDVAREFEAHAIAQDVAANPGWWLDPTKVQERGNLEGIVPMRDQDFGEYRARVLAAAGPGPWQDEADPETRERIAHWLRVGINPTPPSARGPHPSPGRGTH